MLHAARASAGRAATPPARNESLAKHNRKPAQLTENKHQRAKSIASFCHDLSAPPPHPTNHDSQGTYHASRFINHQSLLTHRAFLISSRPVLEIELTRTQQTRKHFLISSFYASLARAPRFALECRSGNTFQHQRAQARHCLCHACPASLLTNHYSLITHFCVATDSCILLGLCSTWDMCANIWI
jgi:hypothetical protein